LSVIAPAFCLHCDGIDNYMINKRQILFLTALLATLLITQACSVSKNTTEKPDIRKTLLWPSAPSKPRIQYMQSIHTAKNLGIEQGLFSTLVSWFTGEQQQSLVRPTAILMTPGGILYVADPGARGVHRFNTKESKYQLIQGSETKALLSPIGLAPGKNKTVLVTDSRTGQVFSLSAENDHATPFLLDTPLQQPTGIATINNGEYVYIVDTAQHKLLKFNGSGKLLKTIGQRGSKPAQFNFPTMITSNNNKLMITDTLNFRVQIFDQSDQYLSQFGRVGDGSGDLARPKGIAIDSYGHIYVVDALFHNMQLFREDGTLLLSVGQRGRTAGQFWLPSGIFIDRKKNIIYVADSFNQRIQVFKYIGSP